ncbi:MAG TPA: hypothetical protein VHO94_00940 [Oscillospiraceae bacterium]|nr:hypothetical protein [Oscillospiraceae bacterium]
MEHKISEMLFHSDIHYSEDARTMVSRCTSGISMIYLISLLNTPVDFFNDKEEIDLIIKFVFNGINGFLPFDQI